MRRLFYAGKLAEEIRITGGDAHHLARVMRAQIGDAVIVAGADGRAARMTVTAAARDAVTLALAEYIAQEEACGIEVFLAQALLKGEKMDFVVQKAAELGAAGIYPVETEHVVVRYDMKKAAAKTARWQKIADESLRSGRSRIFWWMRGSSTRQIRRLYSVMSRNIGSLYEQSCRRSKQGVLLFSSGQRGASLLPRRI